MKQKKGKVQKALNNSPINYFSDLYVVAAVSLWIVVSLIMTGFAIYSNICLSDTYLWSEVGSMVSMPLSVGLGGWMVKNSAQHAMAKLQGKDATYDFPKVNAEGEDDGLEEVEVEVDEDTEVYG